MKGVVAVAMVVVLNLVLNGCAHRPTSVAVTRLASLPLNKPVIAEHNTLKHKVVVASFIADSGIPAQPLSQLIKGMVESQLQQNQHFMLLSHSLLENPLPDQDLLNANDETLGADYIVTGEIERHRLSLPGFLDGWAGANRAKAQSVVVLRVIDGHSGEEVFSRTARAEAYRDLGTSSTLPPKERETLQQDVLRQAVNNALPELAQTLLQRRWRGQILSAQQGFVLINSGAGQGIRIGDEFRVVSRDQALEVNPIASADDASSFLATLRVVAQAGEHEHELSVCELVDGQLPNDDLTQLSVLSVR